MCSLVSPSQPNVLRAELEAAVVSGDAFATHTAAAVARSSDVAGLPCLSLSLRQPLLWLTFSISLLSFAA